MTINPGSLADIIWGQPSTMSKSPALIDANAATVLANKIAAAGYRKAKIEWGVDASSLYGSGNVEAWMEFDTEENARNAAKEHGLPLVRRYASTDWESTA